ncbi:hypothetical protein CDAR_9041 [Caerostris darwini]|uniref:Uncharacterized protein n=1 Tax=Caerostris darwini TaxID=1538125 RepID=A0AAV4SMT8_9ARAC|nr:hypothetical protein CDAR_9041 [Caerostris darwini]
MRHACRDVSHFICSTAADHDNRTKSLTEDKAFVTSFITCRLSFSTAYNRSGCRKESSVSIYQTYYWPKRRDFFLYPAILHHYDPSILTNRIPSKNRHTGLRIPLACCMHFETCPLYQFHYSGEHDSRTRSFNRGQSICYPFHYSQTLILHLM